jgi:uncharacterized protein
MATLTKQAKETLDIRLGADAKAPIIGNFSTIKGLDLLLQDIQLLLLTVPGERVFRPTFGCKLKNQIWENIDTAASNGSSIIANALESFEPRITVTGVKFQINRNSDLIVYTISFIVKSTDTSVNLIFPMRSPSQISAG